jgi:hypothetical protein
MDGPAIDRWENEGGALSLTCDSSDDPFQEWGRQIADLAPKARDVLVGVWPGVDDKLRVSHCWDLAAKLAMLRRSRSQQQRRKLERRWPLLVNGARAFLKVLKQATQEVRGTCPPDIDIPSGDLTELDPDLRVLAAMQFAVESLIARHSPPPSHYAHIWEVGELVKLTLRRAGCTVQLGVRDDGKLTLAVRRQLLDLGGLAVSDSVVSRALRLRGGS